MQVLFNNSITEYNVTQLNHLRGKMIESDFQKNAQSLGFLYNVRNSKFFCGVFLINTYLVLTDGSCVPDGTDFSTIKVYFQVYMECIDHPPYNVRQKFQIPNHIANIIFVLVSIYFYINSTLQISKSYWILFGITTTWSYWILLIFNKMKFNFILAG